MKLLVGIQGTGNGHLSRCHALAEAFKNHSIDVDYLVSGRAREGLFDMDAFGDWQWRRGLTFSVANGQIAPLQTIKDNHWREFWHDTQALDVSQYDLVLTDYEPVTAWAARRQGVRCVGLGRQFAFFEKSAQLPITSVQRQLLKWFTPVDQAVGLHWSPINATTLPPIIHRRGAVGQIERKHYLVYLPFESLAAIRALLEPFKDYRFSVFHPQATHDEVGHIRYFPPSRNGFASEFSKVEGVISNAGFETTCEALAQGKRLLVRPLAGQFEQTANARALSRDKLAWVMPKLDQRVLAEWLVQTEQTSCRWPNVANAIAKWIAAGAVQPMDELARDLWQQAEQPNRLTMVMESNELGMAI